MSNYSIHSIPVYWVLSIIPHVYASSVIRAANNDQWDNTNSRGIAATESYKKSVPAAVFARFERAEAASKNMLESAPLYIGAVAIGNFAGLDTATLNTAVAAYLGLRVAYIGLYINTTDNRMSYVRTAVWFASVGILFTVLIKAGNKVM